MRQAHYPSRTGQKEKVRKEGDCSDNSQQEETKGIRKDEEKENKKEMKRRKRQRIRS